ncbi:MAG: type VI secretion system-associated FHA domain protein TagH [Pseudomonadota bacterium]
MFLQITARSSNSAAPVAQEHSFESFPVTIGRSPDCEVTLPDDNKYVSSRHAEISLADNALFITDTSANGTFINGAAAPIGRGTRSPLNDGDTLSMGEFTLQVTIQLPVQPAAVASDDPFADIPTNLPSQAKAQGTAHDDPFAGLENITPADNSPAKTDDHIDRLEDIGIGPSAWDSQPVDDPFTTSPVGSANSSNSGAAAADDDDWAGWVGSLPSDPAPPPPAGKAPSASTNAASPAADNAQSASTTGQSDALQALLHSAGLNPAEFAGLDQVALGTHIGSILNKSTLSMMLLLRSRDEIKNAMRADVTLLGAQGNSPLQFSITPEDALKKLLTPSATSGFADANKALDKGLSDIKIHQLAMLEAMRSALQIALSHFDPETIEQHARDNSPLASSLPLAREAKLWEQFQGRYNEIKRETVNDFSDLFGRELRKAYEKSVEDLKRSVD